MKEQIIGGVAATRAATNPVSHLSRRDFLIRTGVAATTTALASPLAGMAQSSDRKIRVGIIGGRFGASFQFHEHPNCIVEGVSDLRPERRATLQKVYKCQKAYESLEKLVLDKSIEAVFLATPAPDHVRHALLSLKAGKHVLSAVPAAMNLADCQLLIDAVKQTGLTYMMAETSYWEQPIISARQFYREGKFGTIYCTESAYHHAGLESLFFEKGQRTWRHGFPPMLYPTHCTAHLISLTGERLTEVSCLGWGDADPIVKDNAYQNPFWNESAQFRTNRGNMMRADVWWKGAHRGCVRARYYGDKMSFFSPDPNGLGALIVRGGKGTEKDDAGFERKEARCEPYEVPQHWKTDLLPEPLRHNSGHEGSHTFITHEFIDSLVNRRRPAVDVYEAVAYTAPGIVAHESALKGGEWLKVPCFDPASKG
jgi:predicted dehydrogenase